MSKFLKFLKELFSRTTVSMAASDNLMESKLKQNLLFILISIRERFADITRII